VDAEEDELVAIEPETAAKEYREASECMSIGADRTVIAEQDGCEPIALPLFEMVLVAALQISLLEVAPLHWNAVVELPMSLTAAAHDLLLPTLFVVGGLDFGSSRTVENRAPPFDWHKLKLFSYSGLDEADDLTVINEQPLAKEVIGIDVRRDSSLEGQTVVTTVVQSIGVDVPAGS
jgi:hypothetical protein